MSLPRQGIKCFGYNYDEKSEFFIVEKRAVCYILNANPRPGLSVVKLFKVLKKNMKKKDQKNSMPLAVQNSNGQSAIEYLLLLTAVISVLIIFLNPSGPFKANVETMINGPANILDHMARTTILPPP